MKVNIVLIYIVILIIPSKLFAQKEELQQKLIEAYQKYLSEKNILITQKYLFTLDSVSAVPFDSSNCFIEKYYNKMHYAFNGMETFSDGKYQIKINNPDRFMIVTMGEQPDSSMIGSMFIEGFSGFKNVKKMNTGSEISEWELSGSTNDVVSANVVYDNREFRIIKLIVELSPEHPVAKQINAVQSGKSHIVFISIDYDYSNELRKVLPQLYDFINTENDTITPVGNFNDYQIKFIK